MHHSQHYAVFTSCSQFFFSSLHPAHSASSWQGRMFFIYFRVISHEFVLASLRNPCGFLPWFLTGIPPILFLQRAKKSLWNSSCIS